VYDPAADRSGGAEVRVEVEENRQMALGEEPASLTATAGRNGVARAQAVFTVARLREAPVERALRMLLLTYVVLVASPLRFWLIRADDLDYCWVFALNLGAAQGLAFGRDLIWTNGPLGYLTFPQNIGNNLPIALLFQACAGALLAWAYFDLFFRTGIPLARLALFSLCVGLASPLFWFDRNSEDVFLAGVLTLLVMVRFDHPSSAGHALNDRLAGANLRRYLTALVLAGILPLIKLSGGIHAALALGGFLIDRMITLRRAAWREVLLAALVPAACLLIGLAITLPSLQAFLSYLHEARDLVSGYSVSASQGGSAAELAAALLVLLAILFLIWLQRDSHVARFYLLFLSAPLLFALKHGFARQDGNHETNFFCFAALAIGLIALYAKFSGWRTSAVVAVVAPLPILCLLPTLPHLTSYKVLLDNISGLRVVQHMALAFRSATHPQTPAAQRALMGALAPAPLVGPEMRAIIGDSPVAVLTLVYSQAYFDNLNLKIYPVVQLYSAWTPFLDQMSAEWIRTKGPRYLLFNGGAIDERHPWAQTPALWAEIFRDYETRLLTDHNLLLQRRAAPRFTALETVRSFPVSFPGEFALPPAEAAEFWSLSCPMTAAGTLRRFVFRVLPVTMSVQFDDGRQRTYRSIMDVIGSPVLGEGLPSTLPEFAAVFAPNSSPSPRVRKLVFGGPGAASYQSQCQARWLRIVK
jgi:hypothetical protein